MPLLIASGGPLAYVHDVGAQAAEDFSGVVMLWTHRSPRVAVLALLNSFVWPWGWWLGLAVCALGVLGTLRLIIRSPRAALVLIVTFGPYAALHLLFHETETLRYALPVDLLGRADGRAVLECSRSFVPGRNGGGDQRHLGLRIFRVSVE